MTNTQLWLAIGIPSLLVVLSWVQQGSRISGLETGVDKGFEGVGRKFEAVDGKFEALRDDVHKEINALRDELHRDMTSLRDSIHRDMVALHERVAVVEAKNS